ncbi:MAG: creatininase family protein [Armatimonadetes bacterium]|nr:creatininase family protein [Armatimonadota bacterium]
MKATSEQGRSIQTEVRWERMFPDQLEAAFQACPVVYFAYGLCEPHGYHNALGLDALKAHGICVRAAREHGGIVAPPDYWHIHESSGSAPWAHNEIGQVPRTWLSAIPPWQHFKNVCYHIRAADRLGFKAAILLTGHYGPNWNDLKTLVEIVQPRVGTRLYSLPDFEANQPGFSGTGDGGDHAGKVETSLLWALEPDCVDVSRIPPDDAPWPRFAQGRDARDANRLTGERMVADEVAWLGDKARVLVEEYDRIQPAHTLRTFAQVEELWRDAVEPRLGEFHTMQDLWSGQQSVPEDSVWFENWRVRTEGKGRTERV